MPVAYRVTMKKLSHHHRITKPIPAPLEYARFKKSEQLIIKAHFFIKGYSLKKKSNAEYDLLSLPQRTGLIRNLSLEVKSTELMAINEYF